MVRAFRWMLAAVLVSCGGPIEVGAALPCSARSCDNCLGRGGACVWCESSQSCQRLTSEEASRCRDPRTSRFDCGRSNACAGITGCAACVASLCTWYLGNGRCDRFGSPLGQGATAVTASACPSMPGVDGGDPCPYASCRACVANSSCGWCPGTGRCVGVSSPEGRACSADLALFEAMCPAQAPARDAGVQGCASHSGCGSCVASNVCIWCLGTSTCESTLTTCSPSAVIARECPATTQSQCDARGSNCTLCALQPGCGWCRSSRSCLLGTAGAPTRATCASADWYFGSRLCI